MEKKEKETPVYEIRRKERKNMLQRNYSAQFSGLEYLTFPSLEEIPGVRHLISTRLGGVSKGHLSSMNLSYTRGDEKERVDENFRRIAVVLNRKPEDFVFTDQTHTANVRKAVREDGGKGLIKPRDYKDVDGLVTNEKGLVLSAFFADCVPLLFVDPVRHVIGLSHSGWRGTAEKIGAKTVKKMEEMYKSRPADIRAAIGPSICQNCYEVSGDVAGFFDSQVLKNKGDGKYLLDLWEANRLILQEAGIPLEHIAVADICTCCNPDYLFSHRASKGRRGNLGVFLTIS